MTSNPGSPQRKNPSIQQTPSSPPGSAAPKSAGVQVVDVTSLAKSRSARFVLLAGVGLFSLLLLTVAAVVAVAAFKAGKAPDEVPVARKDLPAAVLPGQDQLLSENLPMPHDFKEEPEALPLPREVAAATPDPEPDPKPKPADLRPDPVVKRGPKALDETVKAGLDYLARNQQSSGGWGASTANFNMGLFDPKGKNPQPQPDQPDLGPTSMATLALLRTGSTMKEGPYAKNIAKAVNFILYKVERSDSRNLQTSELKNTQLHHKIGPYVDTFLALLVLSELKGKMGDEKGEQKVAYAIQKLVNKIEANQKADGTFDGNHGWASVLSQGLAVKALCRARHAGAKVNDATIDRSLKQALAGLEQKMKGPKEPVGKGKVTATPPIGSILDPATPSDAGVSLYSYSANLAGISEAVSIIEDREERARALLADPNTRADIRAKAKADVARVEEGRKLLSAGITGVVDQMEDKKFVKGFGSNGGEEFLSFMNMSEALLYKGSDDYTKWDSAIADTLNKAQDKEGSWSGHHCITGKTFCTAAALLVLMADRAPNPSMARLEAKKEKEKEKEKE